jgi:hypothetical protein
MQNLPPNPKMKKFRISVWVIDQWYIGRRLEAVPRRFSLDREVPSLS